MEVLENKPKVFGPSVFEEDKSIQNAVRNSHQNAVQNSLQNTLKPNNTPKIPVQKLGIEKEFEEIPKKAEKKKKKTSFTTKIPELDFNIRKDNAYRYIPFIITFAFWGLIIIANHHAGEKTLMNINTIRKDLKDLKADYYTSNAALSNQSIQSEVAKLVFPLGLKELRTPPEKIKKEK